MDFSPKKTYRWLTNTWKDTQHCSLLKKCKSKPQWDITSQWSEWLSSKSLQMINAGEGVEKRESSCSVSGSVNWYSHYGRCYGDSLKKLGIKLPYDPAIPLLGICPEEIRVEKNTCTLLFIEALFTVTRTWKQPRRPSTDEWIMKLWCIYTMAYSVQFGSVTQSCPTLCDPMNCSTPGLPVHHQLPEFNKTHVHGVSDAIQPSHPLSSPSPPALNLSQLQGLFKWVSSSHQVAKVLEFLLQHQSLQWIPRTNLF